MLYMYGNTYNDKHFGAFREDIEFSELFDDNPIFPIDEDRFLVLAEYIPPEKSKNDLSIFGKMTVALCQKDDNAKKGYKIKRYFRFGHLPEDYRNGSPYHSFDTSFDICWDYNVIYDLKFENKDFFTAEETNPFHILNQINYNDTKKPISKLFDEARNNNSIDIMIGSDYKEAFIEWATKYQKNELNSEDNFMLYLSTPNGSVANITNNHWLFAYASGLIKGKNFNETISGKLQLNKWMPCTREKWLASKIKENNHEIHDSIYALTNLIKYHFKSLNTGDRIQNLNNLEKYQKYFLDKNFENSLNLKNDAKLMMFRD